MIGSCDVCDRQNVELARAECAGMEAHVCWEGCETKPASAVWQCSGCGTPYPGRVGWCECVTRVLFRIDNDRMLHETKLFDPKRCPHDDIMKISDGASDLKVECADCGTTFSTTAPDLLWFARQIFNGIDTGLLTIETQANETLENVLMRGRAAITAATRAIGSER
jgi:hypothetical protein